MNFYNLGAEAGVNGHDVVVVCVLAAAHHHRNHRREPWLGQRDPGVVQFDSGDVHHCVDRPVSARRSCNAASGKPCLTVLGAGGVFSVACVFRLRVACSFERTGRQGQAGEAAGYLAGVCDGNAERLFAGGVAMALHE